MPHSDPSIFLSGAADIVRTLDILVEWPPDSHAAADINALFPGADADEAVTEIIRGVDPVGNVIGTSASDTLSVSAEDAGLWGAEGDDTLNAGPMDALLSGGSGNDVLTAGAGADVLYGGPGDDRMDGGAGNDFFVMSAGDDVIVGGLGIDTLVLGEGWGAPLTLTLAGAGPSDPGGSPAAIDGADKVSAVENVVGGAGADRITGSEAANILFGSGGDDRLDGGAGNDVLDGGAGADILTGGPDADIFRFQASANDVVTDYSRDQGDVLQMPGIEGNVSFASLGADLLIVDAEGDPVVRLAGITSPAQVTIDYLGV